MVAGQYDPKGPLITGEFGKAHKVERDFSLEDTLPTWSAPWQFEAPPMDEPFADQTNPGKVISVDISVEDL